MHTLMEEHRFVLDFAARLVEMSTELKNKTGRDQCGEIFQTIGFLVDHLKSAQSHYLREENVLFAYLEKHGIAGPPRAMWTEHDKIRGLEKEIFRLYEEHEHMDLQIFAAELSNKAAALEDFLSAHYNKENNVLFPMALEVLTENEWLSAAREFDEIGYCCFTPASARRETGEATPDGSISAGEGMVDLGAGSLSVDELTAMLNRLPVEITFVDKDDTFRYFNQVKDAAFQRSTASIGLKVQNCHPAKSVHLVNKVIEDFRSGAKDEVSFWIDFRDKYIYIRYFAVRDDDGEYLGCMEVTQDIKDIRSITGEKRLLED